MKVTILSLFVALVQHHVMAFQALPARKSSLPQVSFPIKYSSIHQSSSARLATTNNDDENDRNHGLDKMWTKSLGKGIQSLFLAASLALSTTYVTAPPIVAHAESSKVVGELKGSGLVFKDTLLVERFDDPKVKGVTLYISNFDRPLTEKLSKNFFNDPSYASVGCAKTGPISIADNINTSKQGEEVFEESRSLLFKTLRVQRIFDAEKNTVVYVSFNTRLDKNDDTNKSRFKSSLCAVNLDEPTSGVQQAAVAASTTPAAP